MRTLFSFAFVLFLTLFSSRGAEAPLHYQLLEGSSLMDDCAVCAAPSFELPMRGSFDLRPVSANPIATHYTLENINFQAGSAENSYEFTGSGTFEITGQFAVRYVVELSGDLKTATETKKVAFTNDTGEITRRLPMLAIRLVQTNGTLASTITLKIAAAPLRDIWFSTASGFTSGTLPAPDNSVTDGDLLSANGHVVKRNIELQWRFPGPNFLNMGLDAIDLQPGAEIAFSTHSMGILNDGDFALMRKNQIFHYQDYFAPPLATDPGLDALQVSAGGSDFQASFKQDVTVGGQKIKHGDLMTIRAGAVVQVRRNNEFLAAFNISDRSTDYGLDAFYEWPNGEVWFSVATGFTDNLLGVITDGDLLSDSGYIVFRNLELLSKLAPLEDASNFGLDAIAIITDVSTSLLETSMIARLSDSSILLNWTGGGRVYQVERAEEVTGPFRPITPIISALEFEESRSSGTAFYRLKQW